MSRHLPESRLKSPITRREMLKIAALGLAVPMFGSACAATPRHISRRSSAETLQIGCIGTGRQGRTDMRACLQQGLDPKARARIIAVCDVDANRAALAKAEVEKFYAEQLPDAPHHPVAVYRDYRELLARRDIDGVTISTPDHWHALNAIHAAEAGKDIYIQKPLTYSIHEGKALVKAVRRHKVVLQTGSQQRSDPRFRHACELVRNGRIGKLQQIHVTLPPDSGTGNREPMPVPENLDYDLWLGPAAFEPYTEHRVHPQQGFGRPGFLQVERHCLGMITGWGSHMFDIAQWANGSDDTGPVEIQARGEFPDRGLFDVHTHFEAEGTYANGVRLTAKTDSPGVRFTGENGWLFVGRGVVQAHDPAVLEEKIGDEEIKLYVSNNHMLNFLECMRTRKDPVCPVETGHRSNTVCVLTHIAMKLGRKLRWDPRAEGFINDSEANALASIPYRQPWMI
jgi:myo-inositol 2-dehydrogenase / D-chiro-inositol 1-dehydrogenase